MDYYLTHFLLGFGIKILLASSDELGHLLFFSKILQLLTLFCQNLDMKIFDPVAFVSARSKSLQNKTKFLYSGLFKFPLFTWIVTHIVCQQIMQVSNFKFIIELHIMFSFISFVLFGICLYVLFLIHNLVCFLLSLFSLISNKGGFSFCMLFK